MKAMRMKHLFCLFAALSLSGCSFLGLYRHKKAEWASPEESANVQIPLSLQGATVVMGPAMSALKIAMDDYRPPSINMGSLTTPEDKCLARWENIDMRVLQANDNLFYVQFSPDTRRCQLENILPDVGATYAIDGKGRILARE
jgi:hypothetical protein